jgi:LacI family transcriptional regulator
VKARTSRVTLADVARQAAVSIATVSLAIRNHPRIPQPTRQRVWRACEHLGYSANLKRERALPIDAFAPKPRVRNFGFVLVGARANDRMYSPTFHAAATEANREGQHLFCYPWRGGEDDFDLSLLESSECDGFLLMGAVGDAHYRLVKKPGKPIVVVGDHRIEETVNEVASKDFEAGREAVRYLAKLGHKRIAFTSENLGFFHRQRWRLGYLEEMKAQKLPIADGWIQTREQSTPHLEVVKPLFELAESPTAILLTSEGEGHDLIEYCKQTGRRVPKDVSVFFWGTRIETEARHPMTCLESPNEELGIVAVRRLRELVANPDGVPQTILLNFQFHDGGSCAAPLG